MKIKKIEQKAYDLGYIIASGMAVSGWGFAEIYTIEDIMKDNENAKPVKTFGRAVSKKKNVNMAYEWIKNNPIEG